MGHHKITSRGNEELEKLQKVEDDDAETLKDLVEKEENESTSPESYEKFLISGFWGFKSGFGS